MKFDNLKVTTEKVDINYKLYYFLKELYGGNGLTEVLLKKFTEIIFTHSSANYKSQISMFENILEESKASENKITNLKGILLFIKNEIDFKVFAFSLKLLQIKPLLLEETKLTEISEITNLNNIHSLSLQYDTISKSKPYYKRVNGALLSLLFFSKVENKDKYFLAETTEIYLELLFNDYQNLKELGIEANQMFMLMFSESVDQSIVSDAGSSYEDRIFNLLLAIGINKDDIKKAHDTSDNIIEFDFIFPYKNKIIGIGAKRTLRERYKQFIKTEQMSKLDLMIEVTLGIDLNEQKAKNITERGITLFVADEIYENRFFLQTIDGVLPASKFNAETFDNLLGV